MPRLVVERGNEKGGCLFFGKGNCTFVAGRSTHCDLVLTDYMISRQHFKVERSKDTFIIEDLNSHNGTFLNGAQITTETMLCIGDTLRAGETLLSFLSDSENDEGTLAGTKIAGYHLQSRIGVGGMGEVYKASQVALSRIVALKILSPELTLDRTFVERFLSEARAAGKLNHPNVIGVHEVGNVNDIYFLSMEFVDGGSVQDLIQRGKTIEEKRAINIIMQAASALAYAEKVGIVHCDIKPDNLMITGAGEVRLADLGIAKTLNETGKADQKEGVFGSPHYMAPEQARGLPLDHRADLYSLGVTFYRILSGKVPFSGKDAKEIMEKQVFEAPEPLEAIAPGLSPFTYNAVQRLMRKKPGERYQTANALIRDLEKALGDVKLGPSNDTTQHVSSSKALSGIPSRRSTRRRRRLRY